MLQFVIGMRGWYCNSPKKLANKAHHDGRANAENDRTRIAAAMMLMGVLRILRPQ